MLLLPVFDNNYTLAAFLAWPCFSPEHNHCVLVEILGREREERNEAREGKKRRKGERREEAWGIAARTRFPSREFVRLEISRIFFDRLYILRRIFREAVGRNR